VILFVWLNLAILLLKKKSPSTWSRELFGKFPKKWPLLEEIFLKNLQDF